jgi:hypothetical protein
MNQEEINTRIRNAFIMGMATTTEDFNGECASIAFAPSEPYNKGSPEEVDLFDFFANPAVNELADKYMSMGGSIPPNASHQGSASAGPVA